MFYATRTQQVARNVQEHQLLKFYTRAQRDGFVDNIGGTALAAKEANKLMIADVWRTHTDPQAGVFFAARYIP